MSAPEEMTLKVIAHIRTAFPTKFGIPRQSGLVDSLAGRVIFRPRNIETPTPCAVWKISATSGWSGSFPARCGKGLVAHRPAAPPRRQHPDGRICHPIALPAQSLGLSSVRLEAIEHRPDVGPVFIVRGADLMDGTPIYDIKPYIPYADCHPDAAAGFTAQPSSTT